MHDRNREKTQDKSTNEVTGIVQKYPGHESQETSEGLSHTTGDRGGVTSRSLGGFCFGS
jgi:hypothetical protein